MTFIILLYVPGMCFARSCPRVEDAGLHKSLLNKVVAVFDISLDLYKIFCVVVRSGNMSVAAKELFISQPAVSMAMRQLEEKLGMILLIRSSKGIKTTAEGDVLYKYLNQALGLIETAENKFTALVNLQSGEIRIGASDTILSRFLMPYIESYTQEHPGISIKITNRTTCETLKLLKNGFVDIGFVNLPIESDISLQIVECLTVHDCLIGGVKYQSLHDTGIRLSDISSYPLLMLERESNTRQYLDAYAQSHGVAFTPHIELGSSDLLVQFAEINLGVAYVIREFTIIDDGKLFQIPVSPAAPPRHIGLVRRKDIPMSHAAESFMETII